MVLLRYCGNGFLFTAHLPSMLYELQFASSLAVQSFSHVLTKLLKVDLTVAVEVGCIEDYTDVGYLVCNQFQHHLYLSFTDESISVSVEYFEDVAQLIFAVLPTTRKQNSHEFVEFDSAVLVEVELVQHVIQN